MLCFAAKWTDRKTIIFASEHHDGADEMLDTLWGLLDEADAVIHYFGTSFDIPHINREFLLAGMPPPSPYSQVDLCKTIRSQFKFLSGKLDYVTQALEIGAKTKHSGFELWTKCLDGDEAAWRLMRRYNKKDVEITEALYRELLPWIRVHPSVNLQEGGCPKCGSKDLQKRGTASTPMSTFQRYRCKSCHSYSRSVRRDNGADLKAV